MILFTDVTISWKYKKVTHSKCWLHVFVHVIDYIRVLIKSSALYLMSAWWEWNLTLGKINFVKYLVGDVIKR